MITCLAALNHLHAANLRRITQIPLPQLLVPWVPSPSQNHQKHYNNVVEGGNSVTYSALLNYIFNKK